MSDILQVHVPSDGEYEPLVHVTVETDPGEYSAPGTERDLVLSRGGEIDDPDDEPYAFQHDDGLFRTIIPDTNVAVGYYLNALETDGVPEAEAYVQLSELLAGWFDDHLLWAGEFTDREKRLRLMDLAEWRIEHGDFAAEKYLDEFPATWRSTELTESGVTLAADIAREIGPKPRMCYWTAQHAAMLHAGNHRVEYVEGLVLPKHLGQCIRHAWIEIDGEVAELTWPWHMFDGAGAVYFGHRFDTSEVEAARDRRDLHGAIALSDREVQVVGDRMGGYDED